MQPELSERVATVWELCEDRYTFALKGGRYLSKQQRHATRTV